MRIGRLLHIRFFRFSSLDLCFFFPNLVASIFSIRQITLFFFFFWVVLLKAKLGEKNKFYYDEKLKRWVEEGVESPAEEAALPPPPTTTTFQNGGTDYNLRSVLKKEAPSSDGNVEFPTPNPTPVENSSGIPPIPPSSNQFSARGRMGVRSRYYFNV